MDEQTIFYREGWHTYVNENGEVCAVNPDTGELKEGLILTALESGSRVRPPEQDRGYQKHLEQERQNNLRRTKDAKYYFVLSDEGFEGMRPENITRLLYLNSYLGMNTDKIMRTQRVQMQRKDLPSILGVSPATISRFMKEANEYLMQTDEGLIFTNTDVFKRGFLTGDFVQFHRFFVEGVRKLYETTDQKDHKYLGYLFKLLPFVNIEYNVLCWNPEETELDKIQFMTVEDFCHAIGYDFNNWHRLAKIYKDVLFNVGDHQERFCSVVSDGTTDIANARMFVNPNVFYTGHKRKEVAVLGAFC